MAILLTSGLSDGDKGDIDVTGGGTIWTVKGKPGRSSDTVDYVSINSGATEIFDFTLTSSGFIVAASSTRAGWLRVYNSQAAFTADAGRPRNTDPATGSGVILEVVFTESQTISLSPLAAYVNNNPTPDLLYPARFTNDGSTGSVALTLSLFSLAG